MKRLWALGALLPLSGCTTLGYYAQAVGGHLEVMRLAAPVEERLREPDTPEPLRAKLARALAIREFASRELALPDNGSYRHRSKTSARLPSRRKEGVLARSTIMRRCPAPPCRRARA